MISAASPTGEAAPGGPEAPELLELPIGDEAPASDGAAEASSGGPAVLPREAFHQGTALAFRMAGAALGLATLATAPDRPDFPPAADCLYDLAAETPALRWLIEPQALWLQRALVLGSFAVPVALGCQAELRERREAARAARARPVDPAPDPAPDGAAE